LNNDEDIVTYKVEDTKEPADMSKTIFVLKMKPEMWCKSIVLKHLTNGQETEVFEIRTGDKKPEARIDVLAADIRGNVTIILGKAGTLSLWKGAKRTIVDGDSLVGKTVTVDWIRDKR